MPIQKAIFICTKCGSYHLDFSKANFCELKQTINPDYKKGDIVSFEAESTSFGSRFSYHSETGEVLLTFFQFNTKLDCHVPVYVVKTQYCERLVTIAQDEFGNARYVSLCEDTYNFGFALAKRQELLIDSIAHF